MDEGLLWIALPLAVGYALVFWIVSLREPVVPLFCIFALAPFQNDVSGLGWLHFSLSEVHLLLSAPLLFMRGWRGGLGWMGPYLWGALGVTVLLTVPNWRDSSAVSLIQMGLYWIGAVAVFTQLPRSEREYVWVWNGLLAVGLALATAALVTRSSYFWGLNKNGVGASLACATVIGVERWSASNPAQRRRLSVVLAILVAALIIVLSRGAWLAAAFGVGFLLAWRGQYKRLLQLMLLLIPVIAAVWMFLPEESKSYAVGVDASRYNIRARVLNTEWAKNQWESSPWIGVGAGLRKEYDATNVFWLTLAETGPVGLMALLAVHFRLISGVWARRKAVPFTGIEASATALSGALVLGKLTHGLVDHYWSRGAIMIAWASVGMAISSRRVAAETPREEPAPLPPGPGAWWQRSGVRRSPVSMRQLQNSSYAKNSSQN